jgi:hypothetical protein
MDRAESSSTWWCLWTGSSPRVALHPVSRRRSYLRLRTASALSERDFHPSVGVRFQAHSSAPPGRAALTCSTRGLTPISINLTRANYSGEIMYLPGAFWSGEPGAARYARAISEQMT